MITSGNSPVGYHRDLLDLLRRLHFVQGEPPVREVGDRAKVSIGYVSDVLNGKKVPSSEVAVAIARALGATPDELTLAERYADGARADRGASRRTPIAPSGPSNVEASEPYLAMIHDQNASHQRRVSRQAWVAVAALCAMAVVIAIGTTVVLVLPNLKRTHGASGSANGIDKDRLEDPPPPDQALASPPIGNGLKITFIWLKSLNGTNVVFPAGAAAAQQFLKTGFVDEPKGVDMFKAGGFGYGAQEVKIQIAPARTDVATTIVDMQIINKEAHEIATGPLIVKPDQGEPTDHLAFHLDDREPAAHNVVMAEERPGRYFADSSIPITAAKPSQIVLDFSATVSAYSFDVKIVYTVGTQIFSQLLPRIASQPYRTSPRLCLTDADKQKIPASDLQRRLNLRHEKVIVMGQTADNGKKREMIAENPATFCYRD